MMKVENLINARGNRVANQFVITDYDREKNVRTIVFQSYESICAEINIKGENVSITLGRDYDYSRTTAKHLYNFFSHYPCTNTLTDKKSINTALKTGYVKNNVKIKYDETLV